MLRSRGNDVNRSEPQKILRQGVFLELNLTATWQWHSRAVLLFLAPSRADGAGVRRRTSQRRRRLRPCLGPRLPAALCPRVCPCPTAKRFHDRNVRGLRSTWRRFFAAWCEHVMRRVLLPSQMLVLLQIAVVNGLRSAEPLAIGDVKLDTGRCGNQSGTS